MSFPPLKSYIVTTLNNTWTGAHLSGFIYHKTLQMDIDCALDWCPINLSCCYLHLGLISLLVICLKHLTSFALLRSNNQIAKLKRKMSIEQLLLRSSFAVWRTFGKGQSHSWWNNDNPTCIYTVCSVYVYMNVHMCELVYLSCVVN